MSGISLVNPEAVLTPSKLDIVAQWLPGQAWFTGRPENTVITGRFRFVDPDGEVGIETLLIDSEGITYQVPVTYRGAPLLSATLIGTLHHSILGQRWVYDAPTDPVYVTEVLRVIADADTEADLSVGQKTAHAVGSGETRPLGPGVTPYVIRILDGAHLLPGPVDGTLTVRWTADEVDHEEIAICIQQDPSA